MKCNRIIEVASEPHLRPFHVSNEEWDQHRIAYARKVIEGEKEDVG